MPSKKNSDKNTTAFLRGGGEMGELTRAYNWSASALGSPEQWPQSLKTTLSIILNSKFPMFLWWGPELTCFYNDAYRPSLGNEGKHPSILGMPAVDAWPEIWDIIKPLIDQVLDGGEATWNENLLVPIYRNGHIEDVYWTFSYSPVIDESGKPQGVLVTCTETTGYVLSKAKLEASERNLRLTVLQAPVAMAIFRGPQYKVDIVNTRALELWGHTEAEVIGRPILEVMTELESQGIKALLDNVYHKGEHFSATELPVQLLRDGKLQTAYLNFIYDPLHGADGKVDGVITIGFEVTDAVLARKQVEESEQKLEQIISQLPAHVLVIGAGDELIVETVNEAVLPFWNKTREQVLGRPLLEILPELADQQFPDELRHVLKTGETISKKENPVVFADENGNTKNSYVDYSYQPIRDTDGNISGVLVMSFEVTDKVESRLLLEKFTAELQLANEEVTASNEELAAVNEELGTTNEELTNTQGDLRRVIGELMTSESRFRYLVHGAPVAIGVLTGRELVIESANEMILKIWGKTASIIGQTLAIALPELQGQPFLQLLDDVYTSGKPYYGYETMALLEYAGELQGVYFDFIYQPIHNREGTTESIMVVAIEVTQQVKARRAIEASEKRFRFLLNAMPQQVWTATPDGALNYVNDVVCRDFGYDMEVIVGHGWQKFIHPDDLDTCLRKWTESLTTGVDYTIEFRLLFHDGSYRWHLGRAVPMVENDGISLWLGTNTDIELQKNNEQKKDEFLSIASHELKTPLTNIKAFNQLLQRVKDPEKLAPFVRKSSEHVNRLERLISDLLDVTKINAGQMAYTNEVFDFDKMIRDAVESAIDIYPTHHFVLKNEATVLFSGDHYRLEQVVNNLVSNAVKYSPHGKQVIVTTQVDDNKIRVSVQDFGVGIAPENRDQLFDRYYRVDNTAMRFEGLGLGLFISAEIIKRHKGNFWIDSELGKGSTFHFSLPL